MTDPAALREWSETVTRVIRLQIWRDGDVGRHGSRSRRIEAGIGRLIEGEERGALHLLHSSAAGFPERELTGEVDAA